MHLYCVENTISQIAIRGRRVPRSKSANAGHTHGGKSIRAVVGCSSPLSIVPTGDGNDVVVGRVRQRIHGRPYDLGVDPGAPDLDLLAPVDGVRASYPSPTTYVRMTHANAVAVNSAAVAHRRSSAAFCQPTEPSASDGASTATAASASTPPDPGR